MSSINFNFNWFGQNWFQKPPNPISLINLPSFNQVHFSNNQPLPNFASITGSNLFRKKPQSQSQPEPKTSSDEPSAKKKLEQFFWECENLPDYRSAPEVDKVMNEDPVFENKEKLSEEELKQNVEWWEEFRQNPVVEFLKRAEEVNDKINELELQENRNPYRAEDRKLWRALPNVPGLDGRPMPRKAIKTSQEANDKFWDFTKQFFFGLWGFKQRPYPPGRPIDFAQAAGYERLERRYYDFIMRSGGWFYKDRLGRTRGPLELVTLKTAWGGGIIDKNTFIWGDDMDEWAPIHMVYGLEKAIATWEVRLGAAATAALHKVMKGTPPWATVKGHEKKTYKQLQEEALESKRRDLAVLEANGGVWPGVRTPSHALFLWASGSDLTPTLEADHMPNKYIPKDLRIQLAKAIPGLRPYEVLSLEQAMDQITYGGEWYRETLGTFTTGPPFVRRSNKCVKSFVRAYNKVSYACTKHLRRYLRGFLAMKQKADTLTAEREKRLEMKSIAKTNAEDEIAMFGKRITDD